MRRLIIFGASNFAKAAHYYFANDSNYDVAAFTVDAQFMSASSFQELPVIEWERIHEQFPPDDHDVFVALGLRDINGFRASKVETVEAKGYRLASYVSTRAIVPPGFQAEPNTWIMETAHVMPYVTIGRNTIIWGASTIAFNCVVGSHCWIVGGLMGESVSVGDYTFMGLRSTIAPFVKVGQKNIIGAGALILKDTEDFQVYREKGNVPSPVPSTRLRSFNG